MNNFSPLQYFFWLVAGSEIHTLQKCKNDYNRHATIGFVLFMTTIVAMTAGFIAGYYFSHNYYVATFFAFLWASLIYAIDRSMIISLKKKEENEKLEFWGKAKKYAGLVLPRAILGVTIAFFISIPVEIYIFEENITLQLAKDNQKDVQNAIDAQTKIEGVAGKEQRKAANIARSDQIAKERKSKCPEPNYIKNITNYNKCVLAAEPMKLKANSVKIPEQFAETETGGRFETQAYRNAINQRKKLLGIYKSALKGCEPYNTEAQKIKTNWLDKLAAEKKTVDSLANVLGRVIEQGYRHVDTTGVDVNKLTTGANGFARKFTALEHASKEPNNYYLWILLWLIRIVFIGLELLPTTVKIMTSIGDYDRAIESQEREFQDRLAADEQITKNKEAQRVLAETQINQDIEQGRQEREKELNGKIMNEVARVQETIAIELIAEWERQEREKIKPSVLSLQDKI